MKFLEVVFNVPLPQSFYYLNCAPEELGFGRRVLALLGKRKLTGFVIGDLNKRPETIPADIEIKTIESFIDECPIFTPQQSQLAKKVSSFYICALGEVIFSMLPSAKRETEGGLGGFSSLDVGTTPLRLSDEQKHAIEQIVGACEKNAYKFLYLFGVTGSGKTEVYLQAIHKVLQQGKNVLYLVPEIALTHQATEDLKARFGDKVAVLHSGLTSGQRLAQYNAILHKKAKVVVGARSAVFAPIQDLGLVILDEEHDSSYKAGSSPRYHARQVAMMLSEGASCPLVMGSATPSVEAWYLMKIGKIQKLTLTKRLAGGAMPEIETVSMQGEGTFLSLRLIEEIKKTKAQGKQAIVFLNRRGFARLYVCNSCGFQLLCKNCSVPMTLHKSSGLMKCHYCGWQTRPPQKCPECGSLEAGYTSFGTERIEDEIQRLLPECTIERVDADSVSHNSKVLREKLDSFKNKSCDILLGTQMVAKGLNFPDVQLVGIALADTGLQMPDFRASERTFALLTQVAGRAGRFSENGKVIIQTLRPSHPAICLARDGELEAFYEYELSLRQQLEFPPFARLLRIVVRGKAKESVRQACSELSELLKTQATNGEFILGPSECMLSLIAGNSRYQILLKHKSITALQKLVTTTLETYKPHYGVYLEIDVDPVSLL